MAMPGAAETQRPSANAPTMRSRLEAGMSANLSYMREQNQNVYPLWSKASANQFAIFSDKKYFYNGLFFANLSMLGDVTGVKFELGPKPQLVAILGENLRSWQDVNTFLARQSTTYRIPDSMMANNFTGCNKFQYSDNGLIRLSVLIIDITESRDFGQIDRCIFSELISTFGYETDLRSTDTIFELTSLRIMYNLRGNERDSSRIVDEILSRMPIDR